MKCKKCNKELEFIPNFVHEDIELNIDRTDDVHLCECGALHYKEDGWDVYEFSAMPTDFLYVKQVSDQELSKSKIKESELV
jgi:hypothetical protein